jgi:hypothetical protein
LVSYAAPVVLATTGCTDDVSTSQTYDCPRNSDITIITVTGSNFGPQHATIMIGGVVAEQVDLSTYGLNGSEQTTAMAILPGVGLTVLVIQSGGEVSAAKKQLSYAVASVSIYTVSGCDTSSTMPYGTINCLTNGSAVLTISGNNFGTTALTVAIGGRDCSVIDTYTNATASYLTCNLPAGTGKQQFVTLTDVSGTAAEQVRIM